MITNLRDLNDKINTLANYVVKTACENTHSGNYFVDLQDACKAAGMSQEDFEQYKALIFHEIESRDEVLDLTFDENSLEFDVNCGLDYCPKYEWCEGDETIFECSRDEWEQNFVTKPVSQPLSLSRMAEIGEQGIGYVLETSDMAIEDLTERLGMSMAELSQKGIYSFEEQEPPIRFHVRDDYSIRVSEHETFEAALEAYKALGNLPDKALCYEIPDKKADPVAALYGALQGGALMQYSRRYGDRIMEILPDILENNPHVALASSKARLFLYPNDANAWAMRDEAEAKLGITERVVDHTNDLRVGKWQVHVIPTGGRYGTHNQVVNERAPLVVFYDTTYKDPVYAPEGQVAGAPYALSTILGKDVWNKTAEYPEGLSLDGDVPAWTVSAKEMKAVVEYLKTFDESPQRQDLDKMIQSAAQRNHQSSADAIKSTGKEEKSR